MARRRQRSIRRSGSSTLSHSLSFATTLLLVPTKVSAQVSSAFTDSLTGIQFQRFFGARTNFGFGIVLPPATALTNTNSFIGQLTFPLGTGGAGWGGFSLTGNMEGPLLMAAWSDGAGDVVSSFRQAFNEDDNPPEVTGSFTLKPIPTGTVVNNTFLAYTFLCEGCLDASLGLDGASATQDMGWALASRAVGNKASSAGVLGFHNSGFGDFRMNVQAARNARFDEWAALAGTAVSASTGATPFDTTNAGGSDDEGDDGDDSDDEDDRVGGGDGGGGVTTPVAGGGAITGGGRAGGGGGGRDDDDGDNDSDDD